MRVSSGTASVLGLRSVRLAAEPTAAYLMLDGRCNANCAFCAQARSAPESNRLSRVDWPPYPLDRVAERIAASPGLRRICLQTLHAPDLGDRLREVLPPLLASGRPVSVALAPQAGLFGLAKALGVDRVGLGLDACSPEVFQRTKGPGVGGPFDWEVYWAGVREAAAAFPGRTSVHLIVGMGETDLDVASVLSSLAAIGATPSLFAYTPIRNVPGCAPPPLGRYRALQILRSLAVAGSDPLGARFDAGGALVGFGSCESEVEAMARSGDGGPFATGGCPGCNRPFYNERPSGPIYNHPFPPEGPEAAEGYAAARSYVAGGRNGRALPQGGGYAAVRMVPGEARCLSPSFEGRSA